MLQQTSSWYSTKMLGNGRYSTQYISTAVAKGENVKSGMQSRHAVCAVQMISTIHKGKEGCTGVKPTLQRCRCTLLPATADALLDPSDSTLR